TVPTFCTVMILPRGVPLMPRSKGRLGSSPQLVQATICSSAPVMVVAAIPRVSDVGLTPSLKATVSVALCGPAAPGVSCTVMSHCELAGSDVPHSWGLLPREDDPLRPLTTKDVALMAAALRSL